MLLPKSKSNQVSLKQVSLPAENKYAYKRGSVGKKISWWLGGHEPVGSREKRAHGISNRGNPLSLCLRADARRHNSNIPAYTTDRSRSTICASTRTDGNSHHLWIEEHGASYFSSRDKCTGTQAWRQKGWGTFSNVADSRDTFRVRKSPPQDYFNVICMLLSTYSSQKVHNRSSACYKQVSLLQSKFFCISNKVLNMYVLCEKKIYRPVWCIVLTLLTDYTLLMNSDSDKR